MYSQARLSGHVSGHCNILPGHPDDLFAPPSQSNRPSVNTSSTHWGILNAWIQRNRNRCNHTMTIHSKHRERWRVLHIY
ncbi:hypothetical protein BKA82DRAFT_993974, partial [Pisolithus tinctorius]